MILVASVALCCAGPDLVAQRGAGGSQPASRAATLYDWTTDGGDNQRTGWNRSETTLTKDNVQNLTLLWKISTGNQVRALHALMPALVIGQLATPGGTKQVAFVSGISDNLYAIDVAAGSILWKKHWDYPPPPSRGGGGGAGGNAPLDPASLGFLQPGGSSDVPVIGPADGQGRRPIYFVTGDGMLHTLNAATGDDLEPPFMFHTGKGWALNLVNDTIFMANTYAGASIVAVALDDPQHKIMTWNSGSGGAWGRRGAAIDSTGTAWTTTGDGIYSVANDQYANSVAGVRIDNGQLKMKDYYTPTNWDWLRKRDLDPNNTPTLFTFKGRELMAASGKECRMYLLDPRSAGGADHQTPLYKTPLFCNEEVDFQDSGSWGALSTWEDASGTRWVLAPFWGPAHSQMKFPITNTPVTKEGGVAAFKLSDTGGTLKLDPAWVSRDMHRGEPVIVANGMVFGYGSGEETRQGWPDMGLQFNSLVRAQHSGHATIYVLDATTGKELWSSGETITSFSHFSGITVANGRVYLGTYDGTIWCFGLK
jgi:outer membrane protein assembly factor BamB